MNVEASRARLALLHVCDSLFPLGSFAHSDGLETAVSAGAVASGSDLRSWLEATLCVTLTDAEGPAVRDAHSAARANDFAALAVIDVEVDALRGSASGRNASRAMGTRLLGTWQHIRPSALVHTVLASRTRCTYPVAFGVVCAASGSSVEEALESYCYARLAAAVSAAMRLMSIGQHEAHALLADMLGAVPTRVSFIVASHEPSRSFAPVMDIAAMGHQYLHSRLFRS